MSIIRNVKTEWKLIRRDFILIMLLGFVVYLGVVLRFLLPWADEYLIKKDIFHNTKDYFPLIVSYLGIFTGAMMSGSIFSFLTLNDKDDGVITAILTSPLSPKKYLEKRLVFSGALGFIFVLFLLYVIGATYQTFFQNMIIAIGSGLTSVIITVFLVLISKSKTQGLNNSKIVSFLGAFMIIAWFVGSPFEYLVGLFPPYWVSKGYWMFVEGNNIGYLFSAIGIVYQLFTVMILVIIFNKKIYKELQGG